MKTKFHKNRRKFLKNSLVGLSALTFPNIIRASSDLDYDVVVIGAGAAGLAATEELIKSGKKVLCIESLDRIGGRVVTDNTIFKEPYDLGALWIENGETNPFKIFGENNKQFNLYKERSEEMYSVYSGKKLISNENALWKIYDGAEAEIAINANKDIAPIDVVPYQDQRWFDTAHMLLGPWEMGKDFSNYSCKDYMFDYGIEEGSLWHCKEGFGALVNSMLNKIPVSLNTKVSSIDWSGQKVLIETNKGSIKATKCIITVSTGVLSSGQIKFNPKLDTEKDESFNKISMGHYNRVALKFKKLFKKKAKDTYLYYRIDSQNIKSPEGMGITIKPSDTNLCICDPGGDFGKELAKEGEKTAVDFALSELKKIFGNKIEKDLVASHFADWSTDTNFLGAWASAEPGAFKYREILRQPVGDKIYFAGEACAKDWGSVAGAYVNGKDAANKII